MLRCKEGDLAVVIQDEPGCENNIGRMVTVGGPIRTSEQFGPTWLIQPVRQEVWAVTGRAGVVLDMPPLRMVEHPDRWLLPLKPPQPGKRAARHRQQREPGRLGAIYAPAPLIAAMLCIAASKPDGEVEVPEELL